MTALMVLPHFTRRSVFRLAGLLGLISTGAAFLPEAVAAPRPPGLLTKNVILITTDGLRWQEVFTGAEESLLDATNGGVKDVKELREKFWRGTPSLRRQALMPFLWRFVAQQGQIWGNTNQGSLVRVANGLNFSYPGYNELLTGVVDPRIDSNEKIPNRNVTVLEWLNGKPAFRGRCAAFGAWDVFPYIFNRERSGLYIRAGFEPMYAGKLNARQELMNTLIKETTQLYEGVLYDSFLSQGVLDYVRDEKPRVLYVGFGETDDAAHDGRYDRYLEAAHRVDQFLGQLWTLTQSLRDYQGSTTFIITTDHGRGSGPKEWRSHGKDIAGSEDIWVAVFGPDTPPLGERVGTPLIQQKQIAATVAAFLGENFRATIPDAGEPIAGFVQKPAKEKPAKGPQ